MHTLILAGGSGTRLFPLSREQFPKQFLKLFDNESMFQKTLKRASLCSESGEIYVVTNSDQRFLAKDQAGEVSCPCHILIEPVSKNTLPAIYFGIQKITRDSGSSVIAVLPSDHLVNADAHYMDAFQKARSLAQDRLIVFGVRVTYPHPGYGYIRPGASLKGGFVVDAFTEKPDPATAERYMREGYLWNSGMFVVSSDVFFEECITHAKSVADAFGKAPEDAFRETPSVSMDYGIMEKTARAAVVPLLSQWSDVGSFDALFQLMPRNGNGNAVKGEYLGVDSNNNLIITDHLVTTIGISNSAIIQTQDALLIAPRCRTEEVKDIVRDLKERGDRRVESHTTVYRPWGAFTRLEDGRFYSIKRITVAPKRRLSLQMHHHRSEHWVVVSGTAKVTLNEREYLLHRGESTYVPAGRKHRLENPGLLPLEIIEVQIGEYLGEDDIHRFNDDFGRVPDEL